MTFSTIPKPTLINSNFTNFKVTIWKTSRNVSINHTY